MHEHAPVLPESIYESLRAGIIEQHYKPGATITESTVAVLFGVARPTAKLAIERLVNEGLLRREVNQAARVPKLDRADIIDLYANRSVVESAAVAALAEAGAVPPAAAIAHHTLLASGDDFAEHDIAFHRALVAGQSSARLARMHALLMGEIELCIGQVQAAHLLTAAEIGRQHQGILEAIVLGDVAVASQLTRDHIHGARDLLLAHVDRRSHTDD